MSDVLEILKRIEQRQEEMARALDSVRHDLVTVYRRTTVLAQMIDAVWQCREPRMPATLRAEIDASLHPEEFIELAAKDPEEFTRRYGAATLTVLKDLGLNGITRLGELAPAREGEPTIQ